MQFRCSQFGVCGFRAGVDYFRDHTPRFRVEHGCPRCGSAILIVEEGTDNVVTGYTVNRETQAVEPIRKEG